MFFQNSASDIRGNSKTSFNKNYAEIWWCRVHRFGFPHLNRELLCELFLQYCQKNGRVLYVTLRSDINITGVIQLYLTGADSG